MQHNAQEDYGIENIGYQELQQEFERVLKDLATDKNLENFRNQYEKIHNALKKSHQQEKRLLNKCRDLSKDILTGAARVQAALKMSNQDLQTITFLKAQLQKTFKYLQLSKDHQESSREKILKLNNQCKQLSLQLQQNQSQTQGQMASLQQLKTTNEELKKEKEVLQVSIFSNRDDLKGIKNTILQLQNSKRKLQQNYEGYIEEKKKEQIRVQEEEENKKKSKADLETIKREFDLAKTQCENNRKEKKQMQQKSKIQKDMNAQLNKKIKNEKSKINHLIKQQNKQQRKHRNLRQIIDTIDSSISQKTEEKNKMEAELEIQMKKYKSLISDEKQINTALEELRNNIKQGENLSSIIQSGMNDLVGQIQLQKKNSARDDSYIQKIKRDRDMIQKQIQQVQMNNNKIHEEYLQKQKIIKQKENEIFGQKKESDKLNKQIQSLQEEVKNYMLQAKEADSKYHFSKDQVKQRDNFIAEVQKMNVKTQERLKRQQTLYENVRSDRNQVSKQLGQVQQQAAQYKQKYKTNTHQINNLKQQIDTKQSELVKEHNEHKKKDKQIDQNMKMLQKFQQQIADKEKNIKQFIVKIKKLHSIIKDSQDQRQKLQQQFQMVQAERDILGTQLIKRNAEADLLYEKIKINQSTLAKGQAQYRQRLGDIRCKQDQIKKYSVELKEYKKTAGSIIDLKHQLHSLSKQLLEEKLKVKALSEELEKPMNVHRWRKLQATDTTTYELITKIQSLQKRLIEKTEEVKSKELEATDKQKELKSITELMKRQPAVQQLKMIPVYQDNLKKKQKQTLAMRNQLRDHQQALSQYTTEQDRLNKELQKFKKKYFDQKKREQQQREDQSANQQVIKINLPDKRFTGGGFNLVN